MTSLGTLTFGIGAVDINARGQILGSSFETGRPRGFLWQDGVITPLQVFGSFDVPSDLNDRGQIVGYSFNGNEDRAYLWQDGLTTDLGTLECRAGSQAVAINRRGEVAGTSGTATGQTRAVLWTTRAGRQK